MVIFVSSPFKGGLMDFYQRQRQTDIMFGSSTGGFDSQGYLSKEPRKNPPKRLET